MISNSPIEPSARFWLSLLWLGGHDQGLAVLAQSHQSRDAHRSGRLLVW
jgi:hypothetical protein